MERHWFPAILLGASVVLALVFAVLLSPQGQELLERNPDVREAAAPSTRVTEDMYKNAATTLLLQYQEADDAQATYDALIALRVPSTMMSLHYELAIAFGKLLSGDEGEATARFSALKAQYPWLPL